MEQAERHDATVPPTGGMAAPASEGVTRSQHVVYTLPHTTEALAQLLAPALERIDITTAGIQLVIVTVDAETAVAVSDLVYRLAGPQGIEVVPVTSASRVARLLVDRPIHALAGPATELQALVSRSLLKLPTVRTIVLAWADDIIRGGKEGVDALESLFVDLSRDSSRLIVARQITPEIEQLIERYARNARRVKGISEQAVDLAAPVQYVVTAATARGSALRRVLDDLDPPSAVVVVSSDRSRQDAAETLAQLGYRRADDAVRVIGMDDVAGTHTVILYDPPADAAQLNHLSEGAVNVLGLVTPQQLETLRDIAGSITPLTLSGAVDSARHRDRQLHEQLSTMLEHGVTAYELSALESLLQRYDGLEIAAAAIRLLERERARATTAAPAPRPSASAPRDARPKFPPQERWNDRQGDDASAPARPPRQQFGRPPARQFDDRPRKDFGDRPPRKDFGDRPPRKDFGDRPPRKDFSDRPRRDERPSRDFGNRRERDRNFDERPRRDFDDRPRRDFGDRPPKRNFGDNPPKRDFGDRRKGNFGRGPRDR